MACTTASVDSVASNAVVSSEIYQDLTITGERNQLTASAVFRIGGATGTTLDLTAPSKIEYNGTEMTKSAPVSANIPIFAKGTTYFANAQTFRPAHQFSFTDKDGKVYKNSISLEPLELAVKTPFALSTKTPTAIRLSRPILQGEKLEITLDNFTFNDISTTENAVYLDASRQNLLISPSFLVKKEVKKSAQVAVRVSKSEALKDATPRGGSISISYQSADISANLTTNPARNSANQAANVKANTNTGNQNGANSAVKSNTNISNKAINANIGKSSAKANISANR